MSEEELKRIIFQSHGQDLRALEFMQAQIARLTKDSVFEAELDGLLLEQKTSPIDVMDRRADRAARACEEISRLREEVNEGRRFLRKFSGDLPGMILVHSDEMENLRAQIATLNAKLARVRALARKMRRDAIEEVCPLALDAANEILFEINR